MAFTIFTSRVSIPDYKQCPDIIDYYIIAM